MKVTLALACLALVLPTVPALAGIGAKYGTRDPHICANRKTPPNTLTATQYFICDAEQEDGLGNLYLYTEVKVQVAPTPRRFNWSSDGARQQIDPGKPVYDIRGGYRAFQCAAKDSFAYENNPGHACNMSLYVKADGSCWQSTFGEWHCSMLDLNATESKTHVPPPAG